MLWIVVTCRRICCFTSKSGRICVSWTLCTDCNAVASYCSSLSSKLWKNPVVFPLIMVLENFTETATWLSQLTSLPGRYGWNSTGSSKTLEPWLWKARVTSQCGLTQPLPLINWQNKMLIPTRITLRTVLYHPPLDCMSSQWRLMARYTCASFFGFTRFFYGLISRQKWKGVESVTRVHFLHVQLVNICLQTEGWNKLYNSKLQWIHLPDFSLFLKLSIS